ncbi:hypothetical protein [Candidatus Francisella endociliophora]|nr:hypothetical protein [Francisella sp. FSC1006]
MKTKNNKNLLNKLLCGDYSLAKTFWLSQLAIFLVALLTAYTASLIIKSPGVWSIYLFFHYMIFICCHIFILIAIWNSCKKYSGFFLWKLLSRFYSILGLIVFTLLIFSLVFGTTIIITDVNSDRDLKNQSIISKLDNYIINQNMPEEISKTLTLEKIINEDDVQTIIYKNIDPSKELDFNKIKTVFCKKKHNNQIKQILFKVHNQNNKVVQQYQLNYDMC